MPAELSASPRALSPQGLKSRSKSKSECSQQRPAAKKYQSECRVSAMFVRPLPPLVSCRASDVAVQRFNCCHSARRLLASIRRVNIAVTSWADAKGLFNMTLFVTPFEAQPPEL
jgi:hypothetical protein